jgi:hypothetical protein
MICLKSALCKILAVPWDYRPMTTVEVAKTW